MARRRRRKSSFIGKVIVLSIFALAAFGGYTLYKNNKDHVHAGVDKVEKVGKQTVKRTVRAAEAFVEDVKK